MSKKYLFITGGNGEIGKSIISQFQDYIIYAPSSKEMDCSDVNSIRNYILNTGINNIDVLIHCAGINNPKSYMDSTEVSILNTMKINTFSFLYITQELSKHFIDNNTKILAISSIYGSISRVGRLEYNASKSALNGMIKSLALELAPKGIVVNSIAPGVIETPMSSSISGNAVMKNILNSTPLKRFGLPSEIALTAEFVSTNDYVNGSVIRVDGGCRLSHF